MKKSIRRIIISLAVVSGLVLAILATAQIILSPRFCTALVMREAPRFVDGNLSIGSVSVSLFRRFPAISADIDSVLITYPAGRFDESEKIGIRSFLQYAGTSRDSSSVDTLVAFNHMSASINIIPLLSGKINVKNVELFKPRAFLHFYGDGCSNLDIFKFVLNESDAEDSSTVVLPPITLRRVSLDQRAVVCYTSQKDSLAAMLLMKDFFFNGSLRLDNLNDSRFSTRLDSLLVAGNLGRDTLLFDLDHFDTDVTPGVADLSADAKLYAATGGLGRIKIPVKLKGSVGYDIPSDADCYNFKLDGFYADVASIGAKFDMEVSVSDSLGVDGTISIDSCRLADVIDEYLVKYIPILSSVGTDAVVSANMHASGYFGAHSGIMPDIDVDVTVPECHVFDKKNRKNELLHFKTIASVSDLLGKDPAIVADASLNTDLDKADGLLGKQLGLHLAGNIKADIKGNFNLSELTSLNFKKGKFDASAHMSDVRVRSFDDTLNIYLHRLEAKAGMKQFRMGRNSITLEANLDSVLMDYTDAALIAGKGVEVKAFASSNPIVVSDSLKYYPFFIKADIASMRMSGTDSLAVRLRNSSNSFSIHPPLEKDRNGKIIRSASKNPVINVLSRNAMVFARMGQNRVFIRQLEFNGKTSAHQKKVRKGMNASPFRRAGQLSEQDSEQDLHSADISFDFGEAFRKYFDKWDVQGSLSLEGAGIATPFFPMRTRINGFRGEFDNNKMSLDSLTLLSGASHFRADGKIENIRGAIHRRRPLGFLLNLRTDSLDVNELLAVYSKGQENRKKDMSYLDSADFDQVEADVTAAGDSVSKTALIVMPSNINAEINLHGSGVKYSTMTISDLSARLNLKNRCILFENFDARTNMGRLQADAFYSTKTKNDICAGFDLDMNDISAKQMIELVPSVDSLFPLLKSFSGKLSCSIAATTKLDTCMDVVPTSIDGVIRIGGKDLKFENNPDFKKIAKKLMFRKPDNAAVDSMTVEGILKNGTLEIFPFFLKMDRWQMALAGLQNMDKSFSYHVSLIESPLLFKVGVNITGEDFDNFKIRVGKARFKSRNSLPVFTKQIDSTRINLLESIHNVLQVGAEKAIREFRNSEKLDSVRRSQNYGRSAALEKLDATEVPEELKKVED